MGSNKNFSISMLGLRGGSSFLKGWALFLEMTFQKRKSRFFTAKRGLASSSHCDGRKKITF